VQLTVYFCAEKQVLDFSSKGSAGRVGLAIAFCATLAGCSAFQTPPAAPPPPPPIVVMPAPTPTVVGTASWYGPGFHGRPTSSGTIYNQNELTAASTVFPMGSRVMVTNLVNGRSVEVVITDRGPFVKGRKIDLSRKAARTIGMLDKGTARVRIELISAPVGSRAVGAPEQYYVQVGSFSAADNAERVRAQIAAYYHDVRIDNLKIDKRRYYRVRMGGFATRGEAEARATESARFGLPIIIVTE
jgi:rare lipoprotein A